MFVDLVNAKTCNDCAALFEHENPCFYECQVQGFECSKDGKPLDKCPKPKTNTQFSNIGIALSRGQSIYNSTI